MTLEQEFPLNSEICYLNHAAVSPWPKSASLALQAFAQENSEFGATHYPDWLKTENKLRENLRELINAKSTNEIALAKNTSEALSIIAYGVDWKEGDVVVITNQEFPSNRIVWESLSDKGVHVVEVDVTDAKSASANIIKALDDKVRLVSISAVQYASGTKLDIVGIGSCCHSLDILYCIDAIQWLGALSFDVQACQADFVVADGHKWMMGPEGLALFYVNSKQISQLKLNQYGWHMVKQRGDYDTKEWQPAEDATRFECGSPNMLGVITLNASLDVLLKKGIDLIEQRLHDITQYLIEQLTNIEGVTLLSPARTELRAGIVTFNVENADHPKLYRELMKKGVICACRGGGIRFSPHFYTSKIIIDRAISHLITLIR